MDDERTGNLVPDGEELPLGLDSRKRYVRKRVLAVDVLSIDLQAEESELLVLLHNRTGHLEGYRVVRSPEGVSHVVVWIRVEGLKHNVVLEGRGRICGETDGRRDFKEGKA